LGIAGSTPASVVTSSAEHSSVSGCVDELRRRNTRVVELEVDQRGLLSPDDLSQTITRDTRLVSLILGNHETGVLQPIARLAAICNAAGVPLHSDAVQAVGKIPLHFHDSGVAALSFSAHKFHGPRGIGALLLRRDVSLQPILFGGFQQQGLRPGTEPVPLAVGMFRALEICLRDAHERWGRVASLRDRFEQQLTEQIPELVINGRHAPRLPHVSNVGFPGLDRQALLMALDLAGIACSTGSACASGSSDPSPVLRAMKLPAEVIQGSLRFSFSALTEPTEVVEAAACIVKIHNSLQSMICRQKASRPSRHGTSKTI
jgi:cysteine desulfurase